MGVLSSKEFYRDLVWLWPSDKVLKSLDLHCFQKAKDIKTLYVTLKYLNTVFRPPDKSEQLEGEGGGAKPHRNNEKFQGIVVFFIRWAKLSK